MDPYKETFHTWNKLASAYRERFMDFDLYHGTYDAFCGLLPKGAKVLELGCGPGIIGKYLYSKRSDLRLLLTDVAPNMVEAAQAEVPEARAKVLDVRDLASLNENFDAVVAGFVLPYLTIKDIEKLMDSMRKILQPKGLLYLSFVPGEMADSGFIKGSTGDRTFFWFYSEKEIQRLLKKYNFIRIKAWRLVYSKSDGSEETHTIVMARNMNSPQPSEK